MLWFIVACVLPAFIVAWLTTWGMRRLAPKLGLVDQPAARKVHTAATPLGGGIGIYLGVIVPMALAQGAVWWLLRQDSIPGWLPPEIAAHLDGVLYRSGQLWMILGCGSVLVGLGLADDRFGVPWPIRLAVHFLLAGVLTYSGVRATVFVEYAWVGAALTMLWMVVLINALNFLDNMDALSGGIALIAAAIFAIVMLTGTSEPRWLVGGALLVLAGAAGGFLCHNWPPAKIFMGDAGSTFLGLMLASLTVLGTFYEPSSGNRYVILAPLCVLAVPLYDFTTVLFIRLSQGRSPFHPDKNHFSHRLTEMGLSRSAAVQTVHLATLTTGLGALLLYRVQDWTGGLIVVALVLCVLAIVAILETAGRRRDENGRRDARP